MSLEKTHVTAMLAVFAVISLLVMFVISMIPVWYTENVVITEAGRAEAADTKTGHISAVDWWDNPIHVERENDQEAEVIYYTARSGGRDGKLFTADDITFVRKDVNWSKKAGRQVGKVAKEGIKGFWEGMKKKSKHEEE